jgi:lipid A 3-O-deacylase
MANVGHTRSRGLSTLHTMNIRCLLLAIPAALWPGAHAADLVPAGAFVQGGVAAHGAYSATAGVFWPWAWRRETSRGEWTGITEAYVSHWNARGVSERQSFTQLGVVPLVRYHFGQARSGWFLEGGIGISAMDSVYQTADKQFSTRLNFVDVLGVGHSLGSQGKRELGLRISHISNAGIKEPNPGENFVQLRYAVTF